MKQLVEKCYFSTAEPLAVQNYLKGDFMKQLGLYIHVPFCEKKCPYCDFYSVSAAQDVLDKYTEKICRVLENYSENSHFSFDTAYFGGGTPSLIGSENLVKIMDVARNYLKSSTNEVTLEINPTTLPVLDFNRLREGGFNRLSIGLQSAVDNELNLLGRRHSVKDVENAINLAKKAGFLNISLDLMVATPGQTINSLKRSIDFCISQEVQHISAYLLKIEKETQFFENKSNLQLKNEDEEADMYLFLVSELQKNGFKQYEISNFAKEGCESQHNLKYWNSQEYLGIGPSAHSFIDGKRFFYPRSIKDFLSGNLDAVEDGIGGTAEEYAMLKLRLCEGISNIEFKNRFGVNIPEAYLKRAKDFQKHGLTVVNYRGICFTPKGFLLSNELISRIIL